VSRLSRADLWGQCVVRLAPGGPPKAEPGAGAGPRRRRRRLMGRFGTADRGAVVLRGVPL